MVLKNLSFKLMCLFIITVTLCSCNLGYSSGQEKGELVEKSISTEESQDSVNYSREIAMLNIADLRNGTEGIQIRIWVFKSPKDTANMILLNKKNNRWEASVYYIKYHYQEDKIASIGKRIEIKTPQNGW